MRKLSISTKNCFDLQKYENQFIASIASQYANTEEELNNIYEFGILKLAEYQAKLTAEEFEKFGYWHIRQEITRNYERPTHAYAIGR